MIFFNAEVLGLLVKVSCHVTNLLKRYSPIEAFDFGLYNNEPFEACRTQCIELS